MSPDHRSEVHAEVRSTHTAGCGEGSRRKWEYAFAVDWLLCATHHGLFDLDQLPDEQTLRAQLGSPRAVVRQVLQDMAEVGALQRLRSVGTHAPQPTHRTEIGRVPSSSPREDVKYELLYSEIVRGNRISDALFGTSHGDLLRVLRLTHWSGARRAFWVNYLPTEYADRVGLERWSENVRGIARELGGSSPRARYAFTAIGLDEATAVEFEVPEFSPAMHLERTFFGDNGAFMTSFGRIPGLRSVLDFEVEVAE